jgi:hypothetical protein
MIGARPSFKYALVAGAIAIVINTGVLQMADLIPLQTARGGLLKLAYQLLGSMLQGSALRGIWQEAGLPSIDSSAFKLGFHVLIGLFMAEFYAFLVEPLLPGSPLSKGLVYALLVWLANAFIVLPWLGEGIAGSRYLSTGGMAYFAVAHTLFFVLLSLIYARLMDRAQH